MVKKAAVIGVGILDSVCAQMLQYRSLLSNR